MLAPMPAFLPARDLPLASPGLDGAVTRGGEGPDAGEQLGAIRTARQTCARGEVGSVVRDPDAEAEIQQDLVGESGADAEVQPSVDTVRAGYPVPVHGGLVAEADGKSAPEGHAGTGRQHGADTCRAIGRRDQS